MQNNPIQLQNVTQTPGEGGVVTLNIEVAPGAVSEARTRVVKEFSKRIRVPGFRPGSIPAGIVRRNVGDEAIAQEVADQIVGAAYQAALEQEKVVPLERAEVDEIDFDAFDNERPLKFVARVIARPEIELGSTEGLTAVKRDIHITDEDVAQALDQMREEAAYLKNAPTRPVEMGDVLFAEVQVFLDGTPRSEEPANLRGFVVGESGFVPAIDDELVGINLDETKRFTMTYPDEFPDADLQGKEAEFEVKVTAIKEKVVPELTDEFAQIRQSENVEDLKNNLRNYLAQTGEREARKEVREALVEQVVDRTNFDVPSALVDLRLQERLEGIKQELGQNGATMEAYLTAINSTQEQLENDLKEELSGELKTELVLDQIAEGQDFPVSREELEQHYLLMANVTNTPPEELVENVPVANVRTSILQRKAIDYLVELAEIKDEQGNVVSMDMPAMDDEADEALEDAEMLDALDEMGDEEMEDEAVEAGADDEFVAESIGDETLAESEARIKAEMASADVPVDETDRNVVEPEGGPVEEAKTDASA